MKAFFALLLCILLFYSLAGTKGEFNLPQRERAVQDAQAITVAAIHAPPGQSGKKGEIGLPPAPSPNAPVSQMEHSTSHAITERKSAADNCALTAVMMYFGVIIFSFSVLSAFALIRPDLTNWVFSPPVWRHLSLMLIVSALVLFGMREILGRNEITALLGAIAGYMLGQTADRGSTAPEPRMDSPKTAASSG